MLATFGLIIAATTDPLDSQIGGMIDTLASHAAAIHSRINVNPFTFGDRLIFLQKRIDRAPSSPVQLMSDLKEQAQLELGLDQRLLSDKPNNIASTRGALEFLVPQPGGEDDTAGVYVPSSAAADGNYALVVMLHGAAESDADVISREVFRDLAEQTHAILLAPWASGDDAWGPASQAEVSYLIDAMQQRMRIDPRKVYMVGLSMGGRAAFHIAASHKNRFASVLTVLGSLSGEDANAVRMAFVSKPVYLVMGGKDPIMEPGANRFTMAALARGCVPFSEYVAPEAGHDLYATIPQVQQAWKDMFEGVVRGSSTNECSGSPEAGPS